jgi:hypothetical protein
VCVWIYINVLFWFVFFSIPYSWLSNSLFLLDTGYFICKTTSCRPCQPAYLPGFHRFGECVCVSHGWVSRYCAWVEVLIFYNFWTCLPVFSVLCVCVFCVCHGEHRQTNRHSREISEIVPAVTRAHVQRSLARPWAAVVTSVTLIRSHTVYTYTNTHTQVCMFVCLIFWVYLTAGCLTLIRPRSSYNHTYQHAYLCVCMYIFVSFSFVLLRIPCSWMFNSLFLLDTGSLFCPTTSCRPCHRTFSPGFYCFSECACFGWQSTETVLECKCWFSIITGHVLACVYSVCVCVFHGLHRQTNRHCREISEIVPAHTYKHTSWYSEITRTPFSCSGDECDADSLSLFIYTHSQTHAFTDTRVCMFVCSLFWVYLTAGWLILIRCRSSYKHIYQHAYLCVCVWIYIFFCFVLLSVPYSWMSNSLFLLDTGNFGCPTTSCRPCHRTFLPGFHCLGECACFSWLSTEIVYLSASVDFLSLLDMYWPVFIVCECFCVTVCTGRQTDTAERLTKQ